MKWPWVRRTKYDALYRDYWEIREERDRFLFREAADKEAEYRLIHGDPTAPIPQGVINARK